MFMRLLQFNVVCYKSQTPKTIPEGSAVGGETKPKACCLNTNWAQRRTPRYTTCLRRYSNRKGIIVRTTNWLKQVNALACLLSARKLATLFPRLLTPFLQRASALRLAVANTNWTAKTLQRVN
ncbi:hypothetical protein TETLON2a_000070 [Candidatus Hodgkinia cicadicola]|nr:hypothetical protein TETLON2a_000070 [Candidatus Hodgkinia cicadicola]